jgi:ABC-type uncharacterized transport system substrate-binding protein
MRRREFITLLGSAATLPFAAEAQPAMPVIGFMSGRSPEDSAPNVSAFRQGLAETGFVEGQTIVIEFRWANGDYDRLSVLASDLVNRGVAVLVALGGDASPLALFVASANNDAELDAALNSLTQQRVGAFLVTAAPFFDTRLDRIVRFAAENRLPAIYHFREYAIAGGLITYGPNFNESYHNAGVYVGRILKGAKPADLPVLQPTKFDFVINLKAAKALGLTVPPTLVAQASEVIE